MNPSPTLGVGRNVENPADKVKDSTWQTDLLESTTKRERAGRGAEGEVAGQIVLV